MEEDQHHLNLQQHRHQYDEGVMVPDFDPAPTPCYHPTNSMQPAEISYVGRNPNSAAHHFDLLMMAHQQQNCQQQLMLESADHHHHHHHQPHEMMMHNNNNTNTGPSTSGARGFATENTGEANVCDGGGAGGRWPRKETLTLLEIRSRLDPKFKEANQKGPLWDEISRILSDEHGYQRSGKKCREKFENLYKYYKKTKVGKAGRQDGKHYRFFRQLEALYGENKTSDAPLLPLQDATHFTGKICFDHLMNATSCSNPTNTLQLGSNVNNDTGHRNFDSLSLSCNSSDFNTSSSEDNGDLNGTDVCENGYSDQNQGIKKRRCRRNWKAKIKEFINSQMRSLIEIQEVWMGRIMKTMEQTEQERLSREEEWKKREEERMDRERKFWASERQWIQARDANLIEVLRKFKVGAEMLDAFNSNHVMPRKHIEINHNSNWDWEESEITKLMQLRATMEPKFEQISGGCNSDKEFILWEEIATRMASFGSNKSSLMCKNKWDSINNYRVSRPTKIDIACKKQKGDNLRSSSGCYNNGAGSISQVEGYPVFGRIGFDQTHNNAANNNNNVQQQDQSFFRFLVDHEGGSVNLWGNDNL